MSKSQCILQIVIGALWSYGWLYAVGSAAIICLYAVPLGGFIIYSGIDGLKTLKSESS